MDVGGAYSADRASALSGVPKSTVHYWARKDYLVPSVSPQRVKLWSYADLLGLRFIYWLRQPKFAKDGLDIPRTTMSAVRRVLKRLRSLDMELFDEELRPSVRIDRSGELLIKPASGPLETLEGQTVSEETVDLIAPFYVAKNVRSLDLHRPSDFVRIVPLKLSGAPHVVSTRVETEALDSLARRGFGVEQIARLYPVLRSEEIADALDVERAYAESARRRAA